jgi:hypothetical protein
LHANPTFIFQSLPLVHPNSNLSETKEPKNAHAVGSLEINSLYVDCMEIEKQGQINPEKSDPKWIWPNVSGYV